MLSLTWLGSGWSGMAKNTERACQLDAKLVSVLEDLNIEIDVSREVNYAPFFHDFRQTDNNLSKLTSSSSIAEFVG